MGAWKTSPGTQGHNQSWEENIVQTTITNSPSMHVKMLTWLLCNQLFGWFDNWKQQSRARLHVQRCQSLLVEFPEMPGGALKTFFQVRVCGPDFRSVGLANCNLPLKRGACELKISKFGGLWTENFQIWELVSWIFPNLGAWELKFGWKLRL